MLRISAIPKLPDEPDICVQPQPQPQPQKREGKETKDAASHKTVLERLNEKLEEDRHHINYEKYTTCAAHKARYKTLPQELHIPREQWYSHANFWSKTQMVMYHTRYREKMQDVMHLIKKAYEDTGDDSERVAIIARATSTFMRGMRELSVHVQIEEEHVFPRYEQEFPDIDFSWLYEDHKGLHEKEDDTMKVLGAASAKVKLSRAEVLQLATTLMAFDDALNNHLGEEEEVVTPLALFANVGVA